MYLFRRNFGHVEDDDGRLETDTETSNKTTSDDKPKTISGNSLENNTNNEDSAARDDSPPTTDEVRNITTASPLAMAKPKSRESR